MNPEAVVTTEKFLSHDGASVVNSFIWEPEEKSDTGCFAPRGIVQIVHGMSEHASRYDHFAQYLTARNFIVCASDHVGHGKSVADLADLGHLPKNGREVMIEDVHRLRTMISSRYACETPYILLGHSMGSFVVRAYLTRHGGGLSAAILSGAGNQSSLLSKGGNILARILCKARGARYKSALLDSVVSGSFIKMIEDPRTDFDWLATDPAVVDRYVADELCGTMFSVGGYAALTELAAQVTTRRCAALVSTDLPVLFIAGADDPVGSCGKGVCAAAGLFKDAGVKDVEVILYEGMRHEILNEPDRARVYSDVATWIEGRL